MALKDPVTCLGEILLQPRVQGFLKFKCTDLPTCHCYSMFAHFWEYVFNFQLLASVLLCKIGQGPKSVIIYLLYLELLSKKSKMMEIFTGLLKC